MSRKVVLATAVVAICLSVSAQARALPPPVGSGGSTVTTVASVAKTGESLVIDVGAGTPGAQGSSQIGVDHAGSDPTSTPGAGVPVPVLCAWVNYDIKDPRAIASSGTKVVDHVTSILQESVCGGVPTGTLRWFEIRTDESVIWEAYAKAKSGIGPQLPLLAPIGVQYKSWPTNIYFKPEQLAPLATTATLPSGFTIAIQPVAKVVTFQSGTSDGESFVCPKVPVAVEECQYTYWETSKDAPDLKFLASVSITWDFVFSSSGPGSVTFPSETLNQPMRIPVAKIQTVNA